MNNSWSYFLQTPRRRRFDTPMLAHEWVETLVHTGILPMLKSNGYVISVSPKRLIHCLLVSLFRHQVHYFTSTMSNYMCSCAMNQDYYEDDYEFFITRKCPPDKWSILRSTFEIEWFADEEAFADRIWMDIPNIVFSHIQLEKSQATQELIDLLRVIEENGTDEYADAPPSTERD